MFTQTTGKSKIELHLLASQELRYFFARDHVNYDHLLPLYIASMQKFEEEILFYSKFCGKTGNNCREGGGQVANFGKKPSSSFNYCK